MRTHVYQADGWTHQTPQRQGGADGNKHTCSRISETGSGRHLRKVVCSWGTNGLSPAPLLPMTAPRARRMAALTDGENRSPTMRMRGPVIFTTNGLSDGCGVRATAAPMASAATSRTSGDP